jgi:cbb3-type cytochrome oxidase maturation protein
MTAGILLLVSGLVFLSGSALLAFYWAVRDGQFNNLSESAKTIFDADEPVGTPTDRFPSNTRP